MKVLKFGGSSVRNSALVRRVIDIVKDRLGDSPVLVASAMGDTTDRLVHASHLSERGDEQAADRLIREIETIHMNAAAELTGGDGRRRLIGALGKLFTELRSIIHGVYLIRECSPRSTDALLSFGERLSTAVIASAFQETGIRAELVDARTVVRTDSNFTQAAPDLEATADLAHDLIHPRTGTVIVTQGFIGSTDEGVTTTLGRGGSDFSATILGAAIGAEAVEIWTDVDGIMTADPRVVEAARTIPEISYDEAAELAYFGARVVHPYTILPAVHHRIPVLVRNTMHPENPGTRITEGTDSSAVRAVASKAGVTLLTVRSSRMLNAHGFLRAIFEVFDRCQISVDLVATSEVSVTMTVDEGSDLAHVIAELALLGHVERADHKTIICVIGRDLFRVPGVVSDVLASVPPARLQLISFGASEINLSLVVDDEHGQNVLKRLHERLVAL